LIGERVVLPVQEVVKKHWRSVAVQAESEADIYHGAELLLLTAVRIRVPG